MTKMILSKRISFLYSPEDDLADITPTASENNFDEAKDLTVSPEPTIIQKRVNNQQKNSNLIRLSSSTETCPLPMPKLLFY